MCGEVVDSRSHRVPEDRAGRRPDGRRAVDGRRAAVARAEHQTIVDRQSDDRHWRMRLGIDLGGTKIAAVVLDDDGRVRLGDARRRRRATTTTRTLDAIAALVADGERAAGAAVHGRHRHARRDLAGDRPRQERQLDLAERPAAPRRISSGASARPVRLANDANCLAVSEAADGAAAGAQVVFGVILGTGAGGGHRVDGRVVDRRQRDRRRVGPQPAAVAGRRRAARAGVLLRPARLHRDVPLRAGPGGRLPAARRRRRARAKTSSRARAPARRAPRGDARRLDCDGWRSALATVINVARSRRHRASAAGCRASQRIYDDVPRAVGRVGVLRSRRRRASCRRSTATPAACAAPPGCGRRRVGPAVLLLAPQRNACFSRSAA